MPSDCPCEYHGMFYPSGQMLQEECNNWWATFNLSHLSYHYNKTLDEETNLRSDTVPIKKKFNSDEYQLFINQILFSMETSSHWLPLDN